MLFHGPANEQIALRDRGGDGKCPGFNSVRVHLILRAVERFDAFNHNIFRSGTAHFAAHKIDEIGNRDDVRLLRGVRDGRDTVAERCRRH